MLVDFGDYRLEKRLGIVFEEHRPDLTPVYSAKLRNGFLVAERVICSFVNFTDMIWMLQSLLEVDKSIDVMHISKN